MDIENKPDRSGDEISPAADFSNESLLRDYVVAAGRGACIFDDRRNQFQSFTDFRGTVGPKVADSFLNDIQRRVVLKENIIFAPELTEVPAGFINTFRGLKIEPVDGECGYIRALLSSLCGDDEEILHHVLCWHAYPLQHLGAKMRSALVIHSGEGVGKSMFSSVMEAIYGEHSVTITQNDLESQFNAWCSKKLYVVANEVMSRQEMYHKKGYMKNMITEPEWQINEKNISHRKEANRANFIFFSNFLQPVAPDKDDRRFMVLWAKAKKEKEFYASVAKERDSGGVAAFYAYLLNYPLGDFNEFTEPLMTDAKMDLVAVTMRPDERFIELWLNDELPIAVIPVTTVALYGAFRHWHKLNGEKLMLSQTEFSTRLGKHLLITKKADQRYERGYKILRATFAIPYGNKQPENKTMACWLGEELANFNNSLKSWIVE